MADQKPASQPTPPPKPPIVSPEKAQSSYNPPTVQAHTKPPKPGK